MWISNDKLLLVKSSNEIDVNEYLIFRNDDWRLKNSPANDLLTGGCGQWTGILIKILNVNWKKISQQDRILQSCRLTSTFQNLFKLSRDVIQGNAIGLSTLFEILEMVSFKIMCKNLFEKQNGYLHENS